VLFWEPDNYISPMPQILLGVEVSTVTLASDSKVSKSVKKQIEVKDDGDVDAF